MTIREPFTDLEIKKAASGFYKDYSVPIALVTALRKAAARTKVELWDAIAGAIETFTPTECENYFAAAGYDQD